MDVEPPSLPTDEGLRCLHCDYNLTGLTSERCPECGAIIDWNAVRSVRDAERRARGTAWERWPWWLKPVAFVVTTIRMAFLPWMFARELPARPRVRWPLAFACVCFAFVVAGGWNPGLALWLPAAAACVLLQSLCFRWIVPPTGGRYPFRFWLIVCCYGCYPLPIEAFTGGPAYILAPDSSSIWPIGSTGQLLPAEPAPTLLFYLWWADLTVIAWVRSRRAGWWRVAAASLSVPCTTVAVSHLANWILPWWRY